ncbi:MAG TPA: GYF domain-containing protein [Verrucomicrobiae bacterium]|nr:GYF domain-containing protein [Verrucomicrobiae bacterium]
MYKIIGADGKEYGPATVDQIRQWMSSGSVNLDTRTQAEGTTGWKPLREFPELAAAFAAVSPASGPPTIPAPAGPHQLTKFPVAVVIILHYLTCGIFGIVWLNLMHGKLPRVRQDDPTAGRAVGFCFIPFFNLYWIFFTFRRLCVRVDEQRSLYGLPPSNLKGLATTACIFQVIPYINLLLGYTIMFPVFLGMMQSSVNRLVVTSATTQPRGTLPSAAEAAPAMSGVVVALAIGGCGLIFIAIIGILAAMLLPALNQAREKARRAMCMSNEKQILIAIAMYADNNGGRCPMDSAKPTLVGSMQLLSNVVPSAKILFCPDDSRPDARPEEDFRKLTRLNISYSYVPNLQWQDKPDSPIVLDRIDSTAAGSEWEPAGNHRCIGGNIGFIDGHVGWYRTLPCALKDKDGNEVVLSP